MQNCASLRSRYRSLAFRHGLDPFDGATLNRNREPAEVPAGNPHLVFEKGNAQRVAGIAGPLALTRIDPLMLMKTDPPGPGKRHLKSADPLWCLDA